MNEPELQLVRLRGVELGGLAAADPTLCSAKLITLFSSAAGEGMRLASLAMDITTNPLGDRDVDITIRIDKRTRVIAFASAEARAGNDLIFTAQGLFSRAS